MANPESTIEVMMENQSIYNEAASFNNISRLKIEYEQVIKSRTQNQETKYSIRVNNFLINFYKTLSKFEKYDTIEEIKKVKIFSDFYLPIEIIKKTNYESEKVKVRFLEL